MFRAGAAPGAFDLNASTFGVPTFASARSVAFFEHCENNIAMQTIEMRVLHMLFFFIFKLNKIMG
ncbi:MAG: hypothetical protein IPL23_30560 [Saprospiraceae bacterium]|nr:hypothetical protein [Saprospiraceae bacterium]